MIDGLRKRGGRAFALAVYAISLGTLVALLMLLVALMTKTTALAYAALGLYFAMLGGIGFGSQMPNTAERWGGSYIPRPPPSRPNEALED